MIIKDCQMIGHEIWTVLCGLWGDTIGKTNAKDKRMNKINPDVQNITACDDYLKIMVYSWHNAQTIDKPRLPPMSIGAYV
jgi:hypothetical protein